MMCGVRRPASGVRRQASGVGHPVSNSPTPVGLPPFPPEGGLRNPELIYYSVALCACKGEGEMDTGYKTQT